MEVKYRIWIGKLFNRTSFLFVVLLVVFILFLNGIWDYYNQKVVDGFLSKITSHWLIDATFILLTLSLLISTIHLILTKIKISNYSFLFGLFLFGLFFYCRIFSDKYSYEPYRWFSSLKYIDYIFLLFGCFFLAKIWNWINQNKEPEYKDSPFLLDKPISIGNDDKFGRKDFAKKIAEKIQSKLKVENAGSLAIGINGSWGSGKTSFTNIIKEQIDEQNRIVIDFNPWRSSSSKKIIEDFFEILISELKPYDTELSKTITSYAKSLTKIEESLITKITEAVSDFLVDEKNKNEVYESINKSIKKIKKQIIIFIDDLDRLDKKEIIEVLRIIRNTANFNNVVYVVSYDKGYVLTAIKDFNEYNFKSFLEKIFQFEFTLPMYEQGVLRTEIKRLLKEGIEGKFHTQIDRVVDSREFYGVNFTNEIVKTYRDVIRLVNSLLFEIETIKEEVFFYDFYILQLLKLEFPKIYEALIINRNLFFTSESENGLYRFKTEKEIWKSDNPLSPSKAFKSNSYNQPQKEEEKTITSVEKYLNDIRTELDLTEHDKSLIKYLLETLLKLKETRKEGENLDLYKSFAYPANFHKYFAFRLYEGDISAKEFEEYRRRDFNEYKAKIFEWFEKGKYSALIDRLEKVQEFSSIKEFENHILILLEIGRYQIKENINNSYWLDYTLISRNLQYPTLRQNNIRLYATVDKYRDFLFEIFKDAHKPPLFESHVIARLIAGRIDIALTYDELSKINLEYFKEYCATHHEITPELRQLHSNAIRTTDNYNINYEVIPEAQELFLTYFIQNIKGSGLSGFIGHTNPNSDYFHVDFEWLKTFFPTWEAFQAFLNESVNIKKEKQYYDEFIKFYELFKENNHKPVEFVFQYLEPNLWTSGTKSKPR